MPKRIKRCEYRAFQVSWWMREFWGWNGVLGFGSLKASRIERDTYFDGSFLKNEILFRPACIDTLVSYMCRDTASIEKKRALECVIINDLFPRKEWICGRDDAYTAQILLFALSTSSRKSS